MCEQGVDIWAFLLGSWCPRSHRRVFSDTTFFVQVARPCAASLYCSIYWRGNSSLSGEKKSASFRNRKFYVSVRARIRKG